MDYAEAYETLTGIIERTEKVNGKADELRRVRDCLDRMMVEYGEKCVDADSLRCELEEARIKLGTIRPIVRIMQHQGNELLAGWAQQVLDVYEKEKYELEFDPKVLSVAQAMRIFDAVKHLEHAGQTDGAHHKQHDITEAIKCLLGTRAWAAFLKENGQWDRGIPA